MKIFVTGGAGFIGSHLVDKLMEKNQKNEITVYDNLSSGKKDFIVQHLNKRNFHFIKADLLNFSVLKKSMKNHDFVYHMAANPDIRYGTEKTDYDLKQNTLATYNVLEAMRLNDVKKIAFASTSTIYGEPKIIPTPEDYGPLIPISLYGASKLASEALITAYSHLFGMKAWIFRFANIIGRRQTHGAIVDFINKLKKNPNELEILGDGNQKKSYLLVEECVDAMLFAIKNSDDDVNVFNLGCDSQIKVRRIAEILVDEMKKINPKMKPKLKFTGTKRGWPGDVVEMLLSVKKINRLGWRAKYNSEDAVRIAIRELIKENY